MNIFFVDNAFDDSQCIRCGEHSVNMEDGIEICDSCKGGE